MGMLGSYFGPVFAPMYQVGRARYSPLSAYPNGEQGLIFELNNPSALVVRRNKFDNSSTFTDNFWWQKDGVTAAAAPTIRPPSGAARAAVHKITSTDTDTTFVYSNWDNDVAGENRSFSLYVKKADAEMPIGFIALESADIDFLVVDRNITLAINFDTGESRVVENYNYDVDINGEDWTGLPPIADEFKHVSAIDVGDGWWRLNLGLVSDPRAGRWFYRFGFSPDFESITDDTAGVPTKGGYVAAAQFEVSMTASRYQEITTFNDADKQAILLDEHLSQLVMFQESSGITPTNLVEQPVGLFLDKSKGLTRGVDQTVNGTFTTGITGWTDGSTAPATFTWDSAKKAARLTRTDTNNARMDQSYVTVANRWYEVTCNVGEAQLQASVGTTQGAADLLAATVLNVGPRRFVFRATGTTSWLRIFTTGIATSVVDNVTFRELSGVHGYQATAGSRMILCARLNQLTKSEQLNDAVWGKTGTTITTNSLGTLDKIVEDTSTGNHRVTSGGLTAYAGMAFVTSFRVAAAERSSCQLTFSNTTPWTGGTAPQATFNLATGAITSQSGGTAFIIDMEDGTFRIGIAVVPVGTGSFSARLQLHNGSTTSYTGTSGSGMHAGEAQTELGTKFTKYQWIDTATVYDTDDVFKRYLRRDAGGMFLNVTFPAAFTAMTICHVGMVETAPAFTTYGFNNINTSTNVGFGHREDSATGQSQAVSGNGSALAVAGATDVAIYPHVSLVTANGTTIRSRVDGGAAVSASHATNFGGTTFRLGRNLNDTGADTGRTYYLQVVGAVLVAGAEDALMAFAATKKQMQL